MKLAGSVQSLLVRESRQPIRLAALLPLGRRLPFWLFFIDCCDLPAIGSRLRGLALMVALLLPPAGVSGRGSGSLRGDIARRADLNLRLHKGVGRGVFVCYDKQLVEGLWLVAEKLMLEEGAFSAPGGEVFDGLHLVHALAGVSELGPPREVVARGLVGALNAQGELARFGRSLVRAGEVTDKGLGEVDPAVDAARLQAVQPCPGRALEHERNVLDGDALVAVCDVDGGGVVNQPILRLHGAGVLGGISGESEPFGKGLISDAGAKAWWSQLVFFFQHQRPVESVDPEAGVVLSDSLSAAQATSESRMFYRRRGDSPLSARRRGHIVVPPLHCFGAAVLVALDGDTSPTAACSRLLV